MATPQPPERDASPSNVRSWFVVILTDLHGVPENEAREIASKWKYGRGSELNYYDVDTFRLIFGSEAGTLLFGHARRELRTMRRSPSSGVGDVEKEKVERPKSDIFGLTPGSTPLYTLFLLSIVCAYATFVSKGDKAVGMGAMSAISIALFVLLYQLMYFG